MAKPRQYLNKSLDRALTILDFFTEKRPRLTATEIAARLGTRPATLYPTLHTLQAHGYLNRDEVKRYGLGLKFLERGNGILAQLDFRDVAQPYLKELSRTFQGNAHLAVLCNNEALLLHREEGQPVSILDRIVGTCIPLYCTGLGKVLLAYLAQDARKETLKALKLNARTPNTIVKREALLRELDRVRERGYAIDNEEYLIGNTCIAAPIWDHTDSVIGAISISLPTARLNEKDLEPKIKGVTHASAAISSELGFYDERMIDA